MTAFVESLKRLYKDKKISEGIVKKLHGLTDTDIEYILTVEEAGEEQPLE